MKINNYIKLFFASALLIFAASCDLGPFNSLVTDATEEVQVSVTALQDISAEGEQIPVSVSISRTFEVDATVTVQVQTEDLRTSVSDIMIPAGSTSGTGLALIPGDQGEEFSNLDETAIVEAIAVGADDGNGIVYLPVSDEDSFRLINGFPASIATGGITMAFAWDTAFTDDYDISYAGASGATGNPIETLSVPNANFEDGTLDVVCDPFAIAAEVDVPYVLVIRVNNPDGTSELTFLEGTLDTDDTAAFPLASITRTTTVDNSNPDDPTDVFTFVIEQIED
jgi:hypothetical protein